MNGGMLEKAEAFLKTISPEAEMQFQKRVTEEIGPHAKGFISTPLFLPEARCKRIASVTEAVADLLLSQPYQQEALKGDWFVPAIPPEQKDLLFCVDFHLSEQEEKIIEVNFGPHGSLAYSDAAEKSFHETFPYLTRPIPEGVEEKLAAVISRNFRWKRVAIAVSHLPASKPYFPHYLHYEKILKRFGLEGKVLYARDIELNQAGLPVWKGVEYEGILNLVIPSVWQENANEFSAYAEACRQSSDIFFPRPGSAKVGDKGLSVALSNCGGGKYDLSPSQEAFLSSCAPKSSFLDSFSTPEEVIGAFGGTGNVVLKPLDGYQGKGVALKPTPEEIQRIMMTKKGQYIAQEYFPHGLLPYPDASGHVDAYPFTLRASYIDGKCRAFVCRAFIDSAMISRNAPVVSF